MLTRYLYQKLIVNRLKCETVFGYVQKCYNQTLMRRPLGNLEAHYYKYYKILPGMLSLLSQKRVDSIQIRDAFEMVVSLHPMMRMRITDEGGVLQFVEMRSVPIDISIADSREGMLRLDQELRKYDKNGPLWRFVWLQNPKGCESNLFQFLFSMHHSIADFPYCFNVIMDLMNFLKSLQNGTEMIKNEYVFPPAIEQILLPNTENSVRTVKTFDNANKVISSLEAYQHYYRDEIMSLRPTTRTAGAAVLRLFDQDISQRLLAICKSQSVTNTAAILSGCIISFCNLLHNNGCKDTVRMEFSFVTNLRRYLNRDESIYPGVAVVVCPISLDVDVSSIGTADQTFWEVCRQIKSQISDSLEYKKPVDILHKKIPLSLQNVRNTGKTESVITLSNVENVSVNTSNTEINEGFRILDIIFKGDVKIDNYPVFLVISHIVDGKLHLQVSYSSNYTSTDTANTYIDYIYSLLKNCVYL